MFLLVASILCSAQIDVQISSIGPYITLANNQTWTGAGKGSLQNNYLFTPYTPDDGICFYVQNLSSSTNVFSVTLAITGDPSVKTYINNSSKWITLTNGAVVWSVTGNNETAFYLRTSGAARVMLNFSPEGSPSGNGSLFVGQTTGGGCGTNPAPQVSNVRQLAAYSYSNGGSIAASACVTNPGAGSPVLFVAPSGNRYSTLTFERARFSTTVAGKINISATDDQGATCTGTNSGGTMNLNTGQGTASVIESAPCVTNPTIQFNDTQDEIAANTPTEVDLTGFTRQNAATNGGIGVFTPSAITGTVCASIWFLEIE